MKKPARGSPSILERIRVKSRDFDQDGRATPKEELLRLPGPFYKCFVKIPMGEKRSLVFVDLELLNAEFQPQFDKGSKA
jgi:hypothetical protein